MDEDDNFTEEEIAKYLQIFFEKMKEFTSDLLVLGEKIRACNIVDVFKTIIEKYNVSVMLESYDEKIFKTDYILVETLIYMQLCKLLKKNLSLIDYSIIKTQCISAIVSTDEDKISSESIFIKSLKIPQNILPKNYLSHLGKKDEFNIAVNIIAEEIDKSKEWNKFSSYQEYYNYAIELAELIIKKLHNKYLFGTPNSEDLAIKIISSKMNIPVFGEFYYILGVNDNVKINNESMKDMQEHLFTYIKEAQGGINGLEKN